MAVDRFRQFALWNAAESRIEMHLQSTCWQKVRLPASGPTPAVQITFAPGETIHTENSYKFTRPLIAVLLAESGSNCVQTFMDDASVIRESH